MCDDLSDNLIGLASVDLAREKGAFPLFDRDAYLASGTMQAMDEDVRFLEACESMGEQGAVAYLKGYSPSDRLAGIRKAASRHGHHPSCRRNWRDSC